VASVATRATGSPVAPLTTNPGIAGVGKLLDHIADLGNTSVASVPLALAQARADRRLRTGMPILLVAAGAGFTWGGCVVEWGGR
jgi:3-oxoacyl-[acyl-carrier-protein] synthase III